MMKVANLAERWVGYRLNILGVRVWQNDCQLVAKSSGDKWETIGPRRTLPVQVPQSIQELRGAASDSLRVTAYQYLTSQEESDIVEVLAQQKDFDRALRESVALFVG